MSAQDDLRRGARQLRRHLKRLSDEARATANDPNSGATNLNVSGRKNIIVTRNVSSPGSTNIAAANDSTSIVQCGGDAGEQTTESVERPK